MYVKKIIVKNKRNNKERLELTLDEFKTKFNTELSIAIQAYKDSNDRKSNFLPSFMKKDAAESDFYLDLRSNFNFNSNSAWYIDKIL